MDRRLVTGLALAAGLTVAACTEQPQDPSLQGQGSVANVAISCSPNSFNSLINGYFINGSAQWTLVRGYRDAMLGTSDLAVAQTNAFNILAEIASRSKDSPQPSASAGSALAVEVLECVFDVTDEDDVIKPEPTSTDYFTAALSRTDGGAFEVRGGPDDPTGPVQAVLDNAVIAGIAPPDGGGTWDASLNSPQRVLFYGDPASSSSDYHWSVVPRAASFDPALVITTCVDDANVPNGGTLMLTESDVGALAFVDATYICSSPDAGASAGRFDLLRHLGNLGRMLLPEPAVATVVMPGLVGGSAKGVKSVFDIESVAEVELSVFQQPDPNPAKLNAFFTVKFQAKEPGAGGKTVNGTAVTVFGVNNNGTPTILTLDPPGPAAPFQCGKVGLPDCTITTTSVGDVHGLAEFVLSSASPGGLKLIAEGDVVGRNGETVKGIATKKFNVKP
jgi:hypothetical protein